jgi:hypothetical protein
LALNLASAGPGQPGILITAWWQGPEARQPLLESQCGTFEAVWAVPVEKVTMQIAGATVTACRATAGSDNVDEGTLEVLIPDPVGGGIVEVFAHRAVAGLVSGEALMRQILATLRVPAD